MNCLCTKPARVFVFGSNEAGIHGAGAAKHARIHHGAVHGVGFGLVGTSFAIPTKDFGIETLPLPKIQKYVERFLKFAREIPELTFNVTRIGCGLAGYTDTDIAPMFKKAPKNVIFFEPDWETLSGRNQT